MAKTPGTQGFYGGVRADTSKPAGAAGFYGGTREISDNPGAYGFSGSISYNTSITLLLTNASAIVLPLTLTIAAAGRATETFTYAAADFVSQRLFASGTLVTITTSGAGYQTQSVTFTPADGSVATVTLLVSYANSLNTFRRRRTGK